MWDADGKSLAEIEPTEDPREATATAAIMAASKAMLDALEGIVADDDRTCSLADQRARWDSRMEAARAAIAAARQEGEGK